MEGRPITQKIYRVVWRDQQGNRILAAGEELELGETPFRFRGRGNTVCFSGRKGMPFNLEEASFSLLGDHNLIFIEEDKYPLRCDIAAGHGTTVYLGRNFYAAMPAAICTNECAYVYFGRGALLAKNITVRTSDMHMIYSIAEKERINPAGNVFVGEHVWIGQDTGLMKNTVIGAGSIIGWGSLCGGPRTQKVNTVYAGHPAQQLREGVTWRHRGSNSITEAEVLDGACRTLEDDRFIYTQDWMDVQRERWEQGLRQAKTVNDRLTFIRRYAGEL